MSMGDSEIVKRRSTTAQPFINVTPLIDVLLVLLIIFMVVTPLKPSRFKADIPTQRDPNEDQDEQADADDIGHHLVAAQRRFHDRLHVFDHHRVDLVAHDGRGNAMDTRDSTRILRGHRRDGAQAEDMVD